MKFILDNNWSPQLANALSELSKSEPDVTDVCHLTKHFDQKTPDVEWVTKLATEGDWSILTKDMMNKSKAEKVALRESGLVAFLFKKGWSHINYWDTAHKLVGWWPLIIKQASLVQGGAVFGVPVKLTKKFEPM